MSNKKAPDISKSLDMIIKYSADLLEYMRSLPKPSPHTDNSQVERLEDTVVAKFESLSPEEQAHVMFYLTMLLSKMAGLQPKKGVYYSNSVLIARTLIALINDSAKGMNMDIVDIAFQLEKFPVYSEDDLAKIQEKVMQFNLSNVEPQGNA